MTCVYVWYLAAVLSLLAVPGEQRASQQLATPEILRFYSDEDKHDLGVLKMNIEWRDGFNSTSQPQKATYDLRIYHTNYAKLVHNEMVEVTPDSNGVYRWSWTSPIPIQCTSHSVQLRFREHNNTSEWSRESILVGHDTGNVNKAYPDNRKALVNESMVFCCILEADQVKDFHSPNFMIQISNWTFITEPIRYPWQTSPEGKDLKCGDTGVTFYTGYPPDVHNLTCETRDLSSVECRWSVGPKHGFAQDAGSMRYSMNGRACSSEKCVLEQSINSSVTNWTLTAENILGKQTLTDVADPKHRVRLKAPDQAHTSDVGERTAELKWTWKEKHYKTFPMICQVQLNGLQVNETFNGIGLQSAWLKDLQTSTKYKAQIRCGAQEYFYTWGDWSDPITFFTKPDSSQAADVWMQEHGGQTYVVWKPFSPVYNITHFELRLGNSPEPITKPPNEFCYKIEPASTETNTVISVSAKNSDWTSPPSNITLANLSGSGVNISTISASNGGFHLDWEPNPIATCGYVVDWYPTYRPEPCAIEWIKISSGVYSAPVYSDFKEGVSYTLSVYACTSGAPKLLQRREGYVKELAPSGVVQNLKVKQTGSDVYLFWDEVPKVEQRGFILGYNVSYGLLNTAKTKWIVIRDPSSREHKFSLHPASYKFTVKALTSAGEGPESPFTLAMNPPTEKIIITIISILAATTCCLAVLYRKRTWLKKVLYPNIPKPGLSEEWLSKGLHQCQLIDKLLIAEREVVKICYPEPSSQSTADLHIEDEEIRPLYSPDTRDSPWSETWEKLCKPQMISPITSVSSVTPINPATPITVDFSYMEIPCAAVQNPTYDIFVEHPPPLTDTVITPNYIPQNQNVTKQHHSSAAPW